MSAGMIRLICPNLVCRRILAVPPAVRGKTIRCSACGTTVRVPDKKAPADRAEPKPEPKSEPTA